MNRGAMLVTLSLVMLAACAKEAPPPRLVDTTPPPEPPPSVTPAAAPVSKIGRMNITNDMPAPPNGQCAAVPEANGRIVYTGDAPLRSVTISLGDTKRAFVPRSVEIKSSRLDGTITETESIYASFSAEGGLEAGSRDYVNSSGPSTRESVKLSFDDVERAKALATQIMRWCR